MSKVMLPEQQVELLEADGCWSLHARVAEGVGKLHLPVAVLALELVPVDAGLGDEVRHGGVEVVGGVLESLGGASHPLTQ
eukprot:2895228-Pyramimonas_sp.AAC.1